LGPKDLFAIPEKTKGLIRPRLDLRMMPREVSFTSGPCELLDLGVLFAFVHSSLSLTDLRSAGGQLAQIVAVRLESRL
jgi:hypothetical protein